MAAVLQQAVLPARVTTTFRPDSRRAVLVARRTPTAPIASKITSMHAAPSCTSTPCSRALSSIIWSNSLRTTCHVCEHSCGLLSQK
jgi:hypothetical protein